MSSGSRWSHGPWAHNLAGGLGVAQVFHDLLVEIRLLLVVKVEDGQEESEEAKRGSQVEEKTTTYMYAMEMECKCGRDSNLSQCVCDDNVRKNKTTCARSIVQCLL